MGRHVEGKNLIFISVDSDANQEQAKFKAEAKGLEDLANECSIVPKGTYINDQIKQKDASRFLVYVKIEVPQKNCELAKKSLTLQEIHALVNMGYAEQVLKNQQQIDDKFTSTTHSKIPAMSTKQKVERILSSDESQTIRDDGDFFMTKQQLAFLKQNILTVNQDIEDKTRTWLAQKSIAVENYEHANPALKASAMTWSVARERIAAMTKIEEPEVPTKKTRRHDRRPAQKKSNDLETTQN